MSAERTIKQTTIVITGASSGIGRAIALEFAKEHAHLVLAARQEENLLEIVQECQRLGAEAKAVPTDSTDLEAMQNLAEKAIEAFDQRIAVWVNCAGIGTVGDFLETPLDAHLQVIKTNLFGYIHGCYAVLPHFKEAGTGIIINLNSLGAFIPLPFATGYSASKFGLLGFMEALRGELSDEPNIHVCDLYPVSVDTPGYLHAANFTGTTLKPVKPLIAPEVVARTAVELAKHPKAQTSLGWPSALARVGYTVFPKLSRNLVGQLFREYFRIGSPSPITEGHIFEPHRERGRISDGHLKTHKIEGFSKPGIDRAAVAKVGGVLALSAAFGAGLYFAWKKTRRSEAEGYEVDANVSPEALNAARRKLG